jgi:hypothetical protein
MATSGAHESPEVSPTDEVGPGAGTGTAVRDDDDAGSGILPSNMADDKRRVSGFAPPVHSVE